MDRLVQLYNSTQFVNLPMGALGVYGETSTNFMRFLSDLGRNKKEIEYIRCTYYIFCCRNKEWSNPELFHF